MSLLLTHRALFKKAVNNELWDIASAVSDPFGNETNGTDGFSPNAGVVMTSQSSVVNTGTYAMLIETNTTPTSAGRFWVTDGFLGGVGLIEGNSYRITFWARHVGTGGAWAFKIGNASSLGGDIIILLSNTNTTWTEYTKDITVAAAGTNYFGARENSGSNDGGVYFDNFSIIQI